MLNGTWKYSILVLSLLLWVGEAYAGPKEVKACLAQALDKENPIFQVSDAPSPEPKDSRYLVMICTGKPAQELYQVLTGDPVQGEWSGKTRGEFKYLAEDGGASMCYHINTDSEGHIVDDFNCSIRLNIAGKNLGKTTESEMAPFVLKEPEAKPSVETAGFH